MWSTGIEVRQSTPMHRGSEKEEEVTDAHKGAGRATGWVSQKHDWISLL